MRFSSLIRLTGAVVAVVVLGGCPDPEGQFDEFEKRQAAIGGDGGSNTGGAPACETPTIEGEADGIYMFSLSVIIDPPKAFALDATVVTHAADPLTVDLSLQPLSKADQMTNVGEVIAFTDLPINAGGSFDWDLGEVALINAGNPISAFDVRATIQLHGELCGGDALGFICGDVTGTVIEPAALEGYDLEGSKFTMQRYEGTKPFPVINCEKDPAVYPAAQ